MKLINEDLRKLTWVVNVIESISQQKDIEGFDNATVDNVEMTVIFSPPLCP